MQRKKPQLKVDRIFGPELVPQRKGYPAIAWFIVFLVAVGAVGLYQYVTPIWLCHRLEQDLKNAETADEAGLAAESLLALGNDGLAVVVEALADPRIEKSGVAYQVLKGRLDAMTSEEIIASAWVGDLASELRKAAGSWSGESKRFGCQLANAIYHVFEARGAEAEGDRLRWAASRLDTWAVLENHQWKAELEPLRGNNATADEASRLQSSSLVASDEGSGGASFDASSTIANAAAGVSLDSDLVNAPAPLGEVDAEEVVQGGRIASSGGVRFGTLKQTEVGDEPMAHIQVIPKNRRGGSTLVSNVPRGVGAGGSQPELLNTESHVGLQAGSRLAGSEEPNRWEEKIQRIDTPTPNIDLALKQREILELFSLLNADDIATQAAAVRELDERGLSDVEIALATNLVRGDAAARMKLLMDLPRMEVGDRSRWYIWMAQNDDRDVRRVAIQGLGSVADPGIEAMVRELRVHEPDRELKDLLQKILQIIER